MYAEFYMLKGNSISKHLDNIKNKFDIMYIDIEGKIVLEYRIKTFKESPELSSVNFKVVENINSILTTCILLTTQLLYMQTQC